MALPLPIPNGFALEETPENLVRSACNLEFCDVLMTYLKATGRTSQTSLCRVCRSALGGLARNFRSLPFFVVNVCKHFVTCRRSFLVDFGIEQVNKAFVYFDCTKFLAMLDSVGTLNKVGSYLAHSFKANRMIKVCYDGGTTELTEAIVGTL